MGLGEIRLGEMGLGEMGLGEMGQNLVYYRITCQKLCKLAGSRQSKSYCKNYQAYFFGPPCKRGLYTSWGLSWGLLLEVLYGIQTASVSEQLSVEVLGVTC